MSFQEVEKGLMNTVCHPGIFITVWLLLWDLEAFMRLSGIADWFSELLVHYSFSNTFCTQIKLFITIMVKAVSWKDIVGIRFSNQKEIHGKGLQALKKSWHNTVLCMQCHCSHSSGSVVSFALTSYWPPAYSLRWLLWFWSSCLLVLGCIFLTWPPTHDPCLILHP